MVKGDKMGIVDLTKQRYEQYLEREARIINAAIKAFGAKGYNQATITMIASEAEVNEATIYKHFSNKKELYKVCLERVSEMLAVFDLDVTGMDGDSPLDIIEGALRSSFRLIQEAPETTSFTLQLISTQGNPELKEAIRGAVIGRVESTSRLIEEAKRKGQLKEETDSTMLAMMILGFLYVSIAVKGIDLDQYVQEDRACEFVRNLFS